MYVLRVSQKVLFICNLCWLGGWGFRVLPLDHWPDVVVKTVLVCGWLLAMPLGILWYGIFLLLMYSGRVGVGQVSKGLILLNAIFLPVIALSRLFL